jgi:hypothetical protein
MQGTTANKLLFLGLDKSKNYTALTFLEFLLIYKQKLIKYVS